MQKALKVASSPALRDGIKLHIEQTEGQIRNGSSRCWKRSSYARPGRKVCEAMRGGLVEEAQHEIGDHDKGPILDLVIVASMQRIEHYEIAAYGTDIALAKALGEQEIVELLTGILEEGERDGPRKLTEVTEQDLMPFALGEGNGETDNEPAERSPKRRAKAA